MKGQLRLLTATDVATMKKVSARSVYTAIETGKLEAVRIPPANGGKRAFYLIQPKAAEAWTPKKRTKAPKADPTTVLLNRLSEIEGILEKVLTKWIEKEC